MEKIEAAVLRLDRIEAILLQIEANGREALTKTQQPSDQLAGAGHVVEAVTEPRLQLASSERPRRVFLRCNIISIEQVDTKQRHFRGEAYVTARWKEPQLDGVEDDDIHWDDYWDPKVIFPNVVQLERCVKSYSVMRDATDIIPHVIQGFHVTGTFRMTPNYDNFPFDVHPLTVQVTSELSSQDVVFVKDMNWWDSVNLNKFGDRECWDLQQAILPDANPSTQASIPMETVPSKPHFLFRTFVKRRALFYCLSMFLVLALMVILTFCSFAMHPEERLLMISVLTLIFIILKIIYREFMPGTVTLNNVDKYILGCIAFEVIMAIESAIASSLAQRKIGDYDTAWGVIFMFVVAGLHVLYIFLIVRKVLLRNQTLREVHREYIGICDEIQAVQGERHNIVEVKRKKRFSRKQLRESFRKLFSDDEEGSEAGPDGEKTPRRRFPKMRIPGRRPKESAAKAEEKKTPAGESAGATAPPSDKAIDKLEDFELDSSDEEKVSLTASAQRSGRTDM